MNLSNVLLAFLNKAFVFCDTRITPDSGALTKAPGTIRLKEQLQILMPPQVPSGAAHGNELEVILPSCHCISAI